MKENDALHLRLEKTTIDSYKEMGAFWDSHDLTEFWDQTEPANFEVDIQSEVTYYAVDKTLSARLSETARQRGVSPETLLNLWLQEKLQEQEMDRAA